MNPSRKLIIGGAVAAAAMLLMAACVLFAGLAKAESGDRDGHAYAEELYFAQAEPVVIASFRAEELGDHICSQRRDGHSEAAVITLMETPPPPIATHHQAIVIVLGAEWHFCPSYYVGNGGDGGGYSSTGALL